MVNSKANMLVIQKATRISNRVFVMAANGSANMASITSIVKNIISLAATTLIHSAIPNTSDLARCVLQQQKSPATGIIRIWGIAGGLVLCA